jgi:hypothetical protein
MLEQNLLKRGEGTVRWVSTKTVRCTGREAVGTHIHIDVQKLFFQLAQWNKVWYRMLGYS